jgi:hypothetical protein
MSLWLTEFINVIAVCTLNMLYLPNLLKAEILCLLQMYFSLVLLLELVLTSPLGDRYNLNWHNIAMALQVLLTHGLYLCFP